MPELSELIVQLSIKIKNLFKKSMWKALIILSHSNKVFNSLSLKKEKKKWFFELS